MSNVSVAFARKFPVDPKKVTSLAPEDHKELLARLLQNLALAEEDYQRRFKPTRLWAYGPPQNGR